MKYLAISLLLFLNIYSHAQTVGTISNSPTATNGYTLFSPNPDTTAYLIDNCGYVINSWTTSYLPGLSAFLLEDGSLLRTAQMNNPVFTQGGSGGKVQRYDWNGNLIWDYTFSSNTYCQHHDVAYLPNGNVLILATELKTAAECATAGRNPSLLQDGELWPEFLVEVQPIGLDSGVIVWEWHAWDHLVQNFDNTKDNYQASVNVPELFDINYIGANSKADWMHANSVAYNPTLDQIVISSKKWSELWVIDHSTTTSEAASHSGGNRGKGGDILYRWGNPVTYGVFTASQTLFDQHDVHWIPDGHLDAGKMMIFNNGKNRGWSSVDIITPPVDSLGNYALVGPNYGPSTLHWTYEDPVPTNFYAIRISGAQQLPNGNVLICDGPAGHFFEVDTAKNTVWDYINPVTNQGIATQGVPLGAAGNSVFRAYRYLPDYPGLAGKNLTPGNPIELNPNTSHCSIYTDIETLHQPQKSTFNVYPNPSSGQFTVASPSDAIGQTLTIYNVLGQAVHQQEIQSNYTTFELVDLPKGTYIIGMNHFYSQKILLD